MGLFFTKPALNVPAVRQVLREALETQPAANPEDDLQNAEQLVTRVRQQVANVPAFACQPWLYQALRTNPAGAQGHALDQRAEDLAERMQRLTPAQFDPSRFWAAVVFLLLIFGLGVITAYLDRLQAWSALLLHTFELLLGGMLGTLVGESKV